MKIFSINNLKIHWSFSQKGNIWRFIFGNNEYIIGETRDTANKKLYFFSIDYKSGKVFLKNYSFENDNFWVALEGANEKYFYLGRFENPELPYQKNIIALDIESGEKIWENCDYSYLLNTNEQIFGIKKKFESNEIVELDFKTGEKIKIFSETEHSRIFELRLKNEDYIYENSNYPIIYNPNNSDKDIEKLFNSIILKDNYAQNFEYIRKGSLLIFNYYVNFSVDSDKKGMSEFINKFAVYDLEKEKFLYNDILNKITNYCVPDNFFIKDNFLFYLKEKIFLNCIKLESD